jgi:hypothetical protein
MSLTEGFLGLHPAMGDVRMTLSSLLLHLLPDLSKDRYLFPSGDVQLLSFLILGQGCLRATEIRCQGPCGLVDEER